METVGEVYTGASGYRLLRAASWNPKLDLIAVAPVVATTTTQTPPPPLPISSSSSEAAPFATISNLAGSTSQQKQPTASIAQHEVSIFRLSWQKLHSSPMITIFKTPNQTATANDQFEVVPSARRIAVDALAWSCSGRELAVADSFGRLHIVRLESSARVQSQQHHQQQPRMDNSSRSIVVSEPAELVRSVQAAAEGVPLLALTSFQVRRLRARTHAHGDDRSDSNNAQSLQDDLVASVDACGNFRVSVLKTAFTVVRVSLTTRATTTTTATATATARRIDAGTKGSRDCVPCTTLQFERGFVSMCDDGTKAVCVLERVKKESGVSDDSDRRIRRGDSQIVCFVVDLEHLVEGGYVGEEDVVPAWSTVVEYASHASAVLQLGEMVIRDAKHVLEMVANARNAVIEKFRVIRDQMDAQGELFCSGDYVSGGVGEEGPSGKWVAEVSRRLADVIYGERMPAGLEDALVGDVNEHEMRRTLRLVSTSFQGALNALQNSVAHNTQRILRHFAALNATLNEAFPAHPQPQQQQQQPPPRCKLRGTFEDGEEEVRGEECGGGVEEVGRMVGEVYEMVRDVREMRSGLVGVCGWVLSQAIKVDARGMEESEREKRVREARDVRVKWGADGQKAERRLLKVLDSSADGENGFDVVFDGDEHGKRAQEMWWMFCKEEEDEREIRWDEMETLVERVTRVCEQVRNATESRLERVSRCLKVEEASAASLSESSSKNAGLSRNDDRLEDGENLGDQDEADVKVWGAWWERVRVKSDGSVCTQDEEEGTCVEIPRIGLLRVGGSAWVCGLGSSAALLSPWVVVEKGVVGVGVYRDGMMCSASVDRIGDTVKFRGNDVEGSKAVGEHELRVDVVRQATREELEEGQTGATVVERSAIVPCGGDSARELAKMKLVVGRERGVALVALGEKKVAVLDLEAEDDADEQQEESEDEEHE